MFLILCIWPLRKTELWIFFLLNFLSKFIDMYRMDTVLSLILLVSKMLKIPKTKFEAHFLKKSDFVTKKCLAQDAFGKCQRTRQNLSKYTALQLSRYIVMCTNFLIVSYILVYSIPVSELYWLTRCIVRISSPYINSKIIYVIHLLMLKRLTSHFANPLFNVVLKFYVVSLTSWNSNF